MYSSNKNFFKKPINQHRINIGKNLRIFFFFFFLLFFAGGGVMKGGGEEVGVNGEGERDLVKVGRREVMA